MRFTEATIKAIRLPAGKTDHAEWDDAMPGFGVRCRPGSKSYLVQYRVGKKQRRVSIGTTSKVSLTAARLTAQQLFAKIAMKVDPANERAEVAAVAHRTFGLAIDDYGRMLQAKVDLGQRTQLHQTAMTNFLRVYFRPLAGLTLPSIKLQHVAIELARIARTNGPMAMNHARAALSAFFNWAIGEGLCEVNPVNRSHKTETISRDRILTEQELRAVWRACAANDYGRITQLLILTGQRRGEIAQLAVSEINWTERQIELPPARTKNGLPHIVPLSDPALAILREIDMSERTWVFGRNKSAPFSGFSKGKSELDAAAALPHWTIHDLRRTAATRMGDKGVLPHVVEAVLNHTSGSKAGVAGTYNRAGYLKEKRAALDTLAAYVEQITG